MTSRSRRALTVVLLVAVLTLPGLVWIGYMASPTSGPPIAQYGSPVNLLKDAIGLLKEEKWADVLSDYERRGMHLVTVADYK